VTPRNEGFRFPVAPEEGGRALPPHMRERIGSPTPQTLQDPILLLSWLCFQGAFQPLDVGRRELLQAVKRFVPLGHTFKVRAPRRCCCH
jgi:hypothetical protein